MGNLYQTLQTPRVIRYDELDQGFILRANGEVTGILRQYIRSAEMPKKEKAPEADKDGDGDQEMKKEAETKKRELNMELINLS